MYEVIHKIYCLPLRNAILICLVGVAIWYVIGSILSKKFFKIINTISLLIGLFVIVYTTLMRISNCRSLTLMPFITLINAKEQRELYRTLLFNCLLFVPFSLGVAGVLPEKIKIGKRMMIVILSGFVLSISVEVLQYIFSLGYSEVDDVIMNTLGSVIAALALFIQDKLSVIKIKN